MRVEKTNNQASFGMNFPYMESQSRCLDKKALSALRDLLARPDKYDMYVGGTYGKVFTVNEINVRNKETHKVVYSRKVLPSRTHHIIKYLASNKFLKRMQEQEIAMEKRLLKQEKEKIVSTELLNDCKAIVRLSNGQE